MCIYTYSLSDVLTLRHVISICAGERLSHLSLSVVLTQMFLLPVGGIDISQTCRYVLHVNDMIYEETVC